MINSCVACDNNCVPFIQGNGLGVVVEGDSLYVEIVSTVHPDDYININGIINFCPMCGRELIHES